jgi:hypothetical protein
MGACMVTLYLTRLNIGVDTLLFKDATAEENAVAFAAAITADPNVPMTAKAEGCNVILAHEEMRNVNRGAEE